MFVFLKVLCARLFTSAVQIVERGKLCSDTLKKNTANYISLESLINVEFGKKYKLPVSSILQKKNPNNHENDHVSLN